MSSILPFTIVISMTEFALIMKPLLKKKKRKETGNAVANLHEFRP